MCIRWGQKSQKNSIFYFILFCTNIVRQTDVLNKIFNEEPSLIPCFIVLTSKTLISCRFYVKIIRFYRNYLKKNPNPVKSVRTNKRVEDYNTTFQFSKK